jgi:gamma-F420-2:alpha-L-glutamate ligase
MEAWIIYYRDSARYNEQYIQYYIKEGRKLGIEFRLILVEDLQFGVKNNGLYITYQNQNITKPDFVICRAIYPLLSKQLEFMGMKVFNNSFVSEVCNDKAKTYQYLAKTGIKMVDSDFYLNQQIAEVVAKVTTQSVIKAVDGHGGSQVFLIDKNKPLDIDEIISECRNHNTAVNQYHEIVTGLGCSNVVVQPMTGSRHQDLRVYVIGDEIIASVLRTAKDGFKSNFSLGGEVSLYSLTEVEKSIVSQIIEQFEFGLVGIDFIIGDEGELIFNEIEDVVGSRMLYQCSDINIVKRYLEYIVKQIM